MISPKQRSTPRPRSTLRKNSAQLEGTTEPPAVSTTASALGNASTAARSDHTHSIPVGTSSTQVAAGNHTHTTLARAVLIYSGSNYPSRPSGYAAVEFVGPVDPGILAQDNDTWINTA